MDSMRETLPNSRFASNKKHECEWTATTASWPAGFNLDWQRPPSLPPRTVFWITSTSVDDNVTMSRRIHVLINGEQFGPYPENEFRQHLIDRKILRSDLVWREG